MATVWQRPESIEFPKVWKIFKGTIEIDGTVPIFSIEDIGENNFDDVLKILVEEFVQDEILITEVRDFWRKILQQHMSLACFAKNEHQTNKERDLVGISLNCRTSPSDPLYTFQGIKFASSWLIQQHILQKNNFYKQFNVDAVITGAGGFITQKYINQNILFEMIKCRELLGRLTGIKLSFEMVLPNAEEAMKSQGYKVYTTRTSQELNEICKTAFIPDGQCIVLMYINC